MRTRLLRCIVFLGVLVGVLRAQEQRPSDPSAGEALDRSIGGLLNPASLEFAPELSRTNYLDGGISLGTTFDDNVLSAPDKHLSNFNSSVLPYIALRQSRGRLGWKMRYAAGFTMSQRYSALNQSTHRLEAEGSYRVSPHVNFTLRDNFLMTTGFFDQLSQITPSGSPLQRPNQSVVTPLSNQTSNLATGIVRYQFSGNDEIGASGTAYMSRFHEPQGAATLIDTDTQEAEAFYNHRIFARDSVGVTYRFQRLTFSSLADDTLVHSVLATYTWRLRPNLTVSFFAGPQHMGSSSQLMEQTITPRSITLAWLPVSQASWSTAAGSSLNWNGERTSFLANASRTINDGGGVLGAVQLMSVDAALRRQLSPALSIAFGFGYGQNNPLLASSSPYSALRSTVGSIAVSRRLGNSLGFTVGYARAHQSQRSAASTNLIDNNRAWVSLSYDFSRPLGR